MTPDEAAVTILGAGAWGTTLAWMLARRGHPVTLWARRPELAAQLRRTRRNELYRPEVSLPATVAITSDMAEALAGASFIVVAVPSHGVRAVLAGAAEHLPPSAVVVLAAKGIERGTGLRMSQVAAQVLNRSEATGIVALSGPNLSAEIARGLPAAAVVSSHDARSMQQCQELFGSSLFRVYTNCDIIGVELCGAFKNVIALAAGMSDGLGYGENAKAALIARGLAEMALLVVAHGGQAVTCWGLAGLGDLLATCHSSLSRNWSVGYAIGQGQSLQEATASVRGIAEGVFTTAAIVGAMAGEVELPIAQAVHAVLFEGLPPDAAARQLLTRRWRDEAETWGEFGVKPWK